MERSPPRAHYTEMPPSVLEAFPKTRLDNMSIACGCERWQDSIGSKHVVGTGIYSGITYTSFDMLRDIGLRSLNQLIQEIVRIRGSSARSTFHTADVQKARESLGIAQTIAVSDTDTLEPCPSTKSIQRLREEPGDEGDVPEGLLQSLGRKYAELFRQYSSRAPPVGGDKGYSRRLLIDLYRGSDVRCLYLPHSKFSNLIRWIFTGVQNSAPTLTSGARTLIQLTVEETLAWVMRSTWTAISELTVRKAISASDLLTVAQILKERGKILQGALPEYRDLDKLDAAVSAKRADAGAASSTGTGERRVRGRSSRGRGGGRLGRSLPEDGTDDSDSDG